MQRRAHFAPCLALLASCAIVVGQDSSDPLEERCVMFNLYTATDGCSTCFCAVDTRMTFCSRETCPESRGNYSISECVEDLAYKANDGCNSCQCNEWRRFAWCTRNICPEMESSSATPATPDQRPPAMSTSPPPLYPAPYPSLPPPGHWQPQPPLPPPPSATGVFFPGSLPRRLHPAAHIWGTPLPPPPCLWIPQAEPCPPRILLPDSTGRHRHFGAKPYFVQFVHSLLEKVTVSLEGEEVVA